jgi:hypothetical protein
MPSSPPLDQSDPKSAIQSYRSFSSTSSSSPPHPPAEDAALEESILGKIKGDSYVVNWYGDDDAGNPQNLPKWRKWLSTMSLALYVLTTTFASSVFSAAAAATAEEFGTSVETMVFGGTSLFMMGFATGPVIFGCVEGISGTLSSCVH